MGQIVIDIPNKKNRRYVFTDAARADDLLDVLETSAIRVKNNPPSREELEDAADIAASSKALREYARTGESYAWEDVKAELGL